MICKKFIRISSLLLICFVIFATELSAQDQKNDQQFEFTNLFNGEDVDDGCYRIPALITASNGDLIAAIDERIQNCGDLRSNRDINLVIRRSSDNGKTWSDIETVVDYPIGQSASDPSMILDEQTGTIWMFFNYMDLDNEKDIYYLKAISSSDNGKTWSEPVDITSQITKPDWHDDFKFITSGRGIQTSDGTLLHTLVNLDEGVFIFGSRDHGDSWFFIDSSIKPADESKIVELPDGIWMVNSRVADIGMRYVHTSKNRGETWNSQADSTLIDPGSNASLVSHQTNTADSVLFFSNSKSSEERKNMTIRTSLDNGQTWSEGITIYPGSAAYSSMTILKNGNIGILFEADNYSKNIFVEIPINNFLNISDR